MTSLFRNVLMKSKDSFLKESLQCQLVGSVKDVQLDNAHSGRFQSSSETVEALLVVLEAIFIHGLKESLVDKMALAIRDPETRPEPNFWPALLVYSHRELIDQIGRLNFISTDVGRCRSWLRIALNEDLLTSYLQSMLTQNSALNSFYKRSAFLRDKELLDMLITLISSIETYTFNIACNSSLLNLWTNQPLLLAGVWSPAMKACPITSGTDIARSLTIEDAAKFAEDSVSSVVSVASCYESSLGSSAFDEDEALKIILGSEAAQSEDQFEEGLKRINDHYNQSAAYCDTTNDITHITLSEDVPKSSLTESEGQIEHLSEKLISTGGSCSSKDAFEFKEPVILTDGEPLILKTKLQTYHSLVESYNEKSTTGLKMPDLHDLLKKFRKPPKPLSVSSVISATTNESETTTVDQLGFEVVPDSINIFDNWTEIQEFSEMIQQVAKIATEKGLDSQKYICKTCTELIGLNFGPAKVCGMTGAYYCLDCYGDDPSSSYWVIPARIIFSWDFRRFSVSSDAAVFLSEIHLYPLFDISIINPKIYTAIEEMESLKDLRVRLNILKTYLITCRSKVIETLQRNLWPRDYLYEKVHHYSLADLIQVSTGALESLLQKAVDMSRSHVLTCSLCSQKGFICEICNVPKVIFPFDIESTYRCKNCNAVYHSECLQAVQKCPKCIRIQKREVSSQLL